jgi:hypothetical protein
MNPAGSSGRDRQDGTHAPDANEKRTHALTLGRHLNGLRVANARDIHASADQRFERFGVGREINHCYVEAFVFVEPQRIGKSEGHLLRLEAGAEEREPDTQPISMAGTTNAQQTYGKKESDGRSLAGTPLAWGTRPRSEVSIKSRHGAHGCMRHGCLE